MRSEFKFPKLIVLLLAIVLSGGDAVSPSVCTGQSPDSPTQELDSPISQSGSSASEFDNSGQASPERVAPPDLSIRPTDPSSDDPRADPRIKRTDRPLSYWAEQLSHDRYLRRESAQRHLIAGGQASVPVLMRTLQDSNLETVESVISILAAIAESEEPARTDGAVDALQHIASTSLGSKASLAKSAIDSISETRRQIAHLRLRKDGVFVGTKNVALGSRSIDRLVAEISDRWTGSIQALAWIRWLEDVRFVIISGQAAIPEVFDAVSKMPNLEVLVVRDCELAPGSLEKLSGTTRLDAFELRYVRLNETLLAEIAQMRLRNSLYLLGTGISDERVERLKLEMPGLEITHRRGGFLGVICRSIGADYCEVSEVMRGSGADDAGLKPGDIVIQIDGIKITRFEDLQRQINTHIPGEEIKIRVVRDGETVDTVATLKKQESQ